MNGVEIDGVRIVLYIYSSIGDHGRHWMPFSIRFEKKNKRERG